MIKYKYSVLDEKNNIIKGELEAVNTEDAREILSAEGHKVIRLSPKIISKGFLMGYEPKKISTQDIAIFCKQLSIITKSGISILRGLLMVRGQTSSKKVKHLAENLYLRIQKGYSVSNAFRNSGYRLPLLLINMIEVGEISGNMDSIFKRMADYYEKEHNTKKKIISAMIYPIILLCVSLGVVILFTFFILPELVGIISETGGELPLITKVLLDGSKFLANNITYVLLGVILVIVGYIKIIPYSVKQKVKSYLLFKVPGVAVVSKDFVTARFLRTMGMLVKTGLSMLVILETLENVVGNEDLSKGINTAREKINKGESLTVSLEGIGFFDAMVTNIISIGEEAGNMDEPLLELADYYDEKFNSGISKLISLVEPMFTLGMGVVIGTIVLSAMLPMFNMISSFSSIREQ